MGTSLLSTLSIWTIAPSILSWICNFVAGLSVPIPTLCGIYTSVLLVPNTIWCDFVILALEPNAVEFVGECFAPNQRVYVFFDGIDVNAYVTPASSTFTSDTTIAAGSPLITTAAGRIEGTFNIPDYKFAGQENIPKFRTGEVEFRITSSDTNQKSTTNAISQDGVELGDPFTAGQTTYMAKGLLETTQDTIVATRNAKLVQNFDI